MIKTIGFHSTSSAGLGLEISEWLYKMQKGTYGDINFKLIDIKYSTVEHETYMTEVHHDALVVYSIDDQ